MTQVLLIAFLATLIYLSISNRLLGYLKILALQGVLLFGISFLALHEISPLNLVFVLLETIIFKTIAVPYFMGYVIRKNNITREAEPYLSNFISLVIVTVIITGTFLLSNLVNEAQLNKLFFVAALSSLFTGLYIILTRRKIITHVMGFLIIENGVFVLSLAVGNEMPMLVNTGILLDLFVSVLLLGVFANKIGDVMGDAGVEQLSQLKD
ncbi:MAG: hypothetical protein D6816_10275 [Bacteroidetes bacterium]|nr:MAG: hypothetical protein D6816_10275 [Bacteroidota bacterium]